MDKNEIECAVMMLREAEKAITSGNADWFAIAWKKNQTTVKCRSEKAPKSIRLESR